MNDSDKEVFDTLLGLIKTIIGELNKTIVQVNLLEKKLEDKK